MDYSAVQQTITQIARQAGAVLMDYFEKPLNPTIKNGLYDVVTDADTASERMIVEALASAFPDHHIVGEEGGGMGTPIQEAAYRWYVDPLDGTVNYANHIPMFAVSLALTGADMRPLLGVVYNPVSGELFSAMKGGGATLNGKPIQVSRATLLRHCVLSSGFAYDKYTNPDNNLKQWGDFLVRSRGMRRMGSAALDLCFVAAGRFDGYWESKLNPWDCLAGMLCVTEAGGVVTDYQGCIDDHLYSGARVVASNGHIHQQMLDVLNA